ncbi:hypothetical protein pb186bvf_009213 [Paramecium bursaria]
MNVIKGYHMVKGTKQILQFLDLRYHSPQLFIQKFQALDEQRLIILKTDQ